jgi:F-type H+-transporting ATPase subunit b
VDILAIAGGAPGALLQVLAAEAGEEGGAGLQINLFWIIVASLNFVILLVLLWTFALKPVSRMLDERRQRIETGLRDAEQARHDRDQAEAERTATLAESRREANDILNRAQRVAQEAHDAQLAETRSELERIRQQAVAEIDAEKKRAMSDLRAEVASLALEAAARVVGETMDGPRQRRLVEEFLQESAAVESKT